MDILMVTVVWVRWHLMLGVYLHEVAWHLRETVQCEAFIETPTRYERGMTLSRHPKLSGFSGCSSHCSKFAGTNPQA